MWQLLHTQILAWLLTGKGSSCASGPGLTCAALLQVTYVKFHWKPTCGVKNLLEDEAVTVGGSNHSHATQVCCCHGPAVTPPADKPHFVSWACCALVQSCNPLHCLLGRVSQPQLGTPSSCSKHVPDSLSAVY